VHCESWLGCMYSRHRLLSQARFPNTVERCRGVTGSHRPWWHLGLPCSHLSLAAHPSFDDSPAPSGPRAHHSSHPPRQRGGQAARRASLRALQQQRPPRRTRRRVQPQPRCRAGDAKKQCSFPCHSQTLGHVQPCLPGVPCKSRVLDASLVFARAGAGPSYSTPCLLRTEHTTTLLAP
jgi:hypothetical protein